MYVPAGFPTVFRSGGDQGDGGDPGTTAPPLDISYSPVRHIESTPFPQSFTLFPFLLPFQKKGIIHVLARCAVYRFTQGSKTTCCVFLPGLLYALAVTSSQNSVFKLWWYFIFQFQFFNAYLRCLTQQLSRGVGWRVRGGRIRCSVAGSVFLPVLRKACF